MNRRDIKNKNKIADTDTGTDNELQPLQGFSEGGFNSNGLNNKFGKLCVKMYGATLSGTICETRVIGGINMQ